ncbi:glycosyltransferase [Candidatus Woesebacteria bacterium]|nr:glycosyltransferase [Candidatus Woesebacteria bacterium]
MRIALVHDYLLEAGGAERVLRVLSDMYPTASIYTALTKNGTAKAMFGDRQIVESKWGWFLKIGRFYSYFRFLIPWVWQSMDLTKYDLVITSCSGYIARGFKVRPDAKVIAYCHTPPRWLYGYDTPTGAQAKWWGKMFMWIVGPFVRYFDFQSAQRVDAWIANSKEVAGRISKFYRKDAIVVYPPIEITEQKNKNIEYRKIENYYLMISRIVGGKGIYEASQSFKKLGIKLKIVGELVDTKLGKQVDCVGRVSDSELAELYGNAKGFVALSRDEDFGMTVVESMAYGTPVLAYNGGGYKETVVPGKNGILIDGTDVKSVRAGIEKMQSIKWNREEIKKWASKFGRDKFERLVSNIIQSE